MESNTKLEIEFKSPNPEWVERCNARGWTRDHDFPDGKMNKLKHMLLDMAGFAACLHREDDIEKLLSVRAELLDGANSEMRRGQPSRCHSNSASIWYDNQGSILLYTGYALSADGMWRQHSWCVINDGSKRVIETTEERLAYFGFPMSNIEAEEFFYNNL